MKHAYFIAIPLILVTVGFTVWAFSASMTPYVDIRTARASDSRVQVRGQILHDTVRYDTSVGALRFMIKDKNGEQIEVVYSGAKPDAFDSAPETAATGVVQNGVFKSDSLVVKCPSKYDDRKSPYRPKAESDAPAGGGRSAPNDRAPGSRSKG
jgi:cytochrome c-type biogenesis protein CcmE